MSISHNTKTIAKYGISLGLIAYALKDQDLSHIIQQISTSDKIWLLLAFMSVALGFIPAALRWRELLYALKYKLQLNDLLRVMWITQFFNQTLPSAIGGDVVRIWLAHKYRISSQAAISSVLADRFIGLIALSVIAASASYQLNYQQVSSRFFFILTFLLLLCPMIITHVPDFVFRKLRVFDHIKIAHKILEFSNEFRTMFVDYSACVIAFIYSIICQFSAICAVFFVSNAMHFSIDFKYFLFVVPVANLITTLPLSIAGWGLRESVYIYMFTTAGLEKSEALSLSLVYGVVMLFAGLSGAIPWFMIKGTKISNLNNISDTVEKKSL